MTFRGCPHPTESVRSISQHAVSSSVNSPLLVQPNVSVTLDTLHLVFSAFGLVQKIATFEKGQGFQALVQYSDPETAEQVWPIFPITSASASCLTLHHAVSAATAALFPLCDPWMPVIISLASLPPPARLPSDSLQLESLVPLEYVLTRQQTLLY